MHVQRRETGKGTKSRRGQRTVGERPAIEFFPHGIEPHPRGLDQLRILIVERGERNVVVQNRRTRLVGAPQMTRKGLRHGIAVRQTGTLARSKSNVSSWWRHGIIGFNFNALNQGAGFLQVTVGAGGTCCCFIIIIVIIVRSGRGKSVQWAIAVGVLVVVLLVVVISTRRRRRRQCLRFGRVVVVKDSHHQDAFAPLRLLRTQLRIHQELTSCCCGCFAGSIPSVGGLGCHQEAQMTSLPAQNIVIHNCVASIVATTTTTTTTRCHTHRGTHQRIHDGPDQNVGSNGNQTSAHGQRRRPMGTTRFAGGRFGKTGKPRFQARFGARNANFRIRRQPGRVGAQGKGQGKSIHVGQVPAILLHVHVETLLVILQFVRNGCGFSHDQQRFLVIVVVVVCGRRKEGGRG
mmetsp:Transcript_664/g.1977  ORF Transcript_664/g.1977 Transcript_664/m.1977 type:complete len:404 (-) Transcript_664:383-1594(-)